MFLRSLADALTERFKLLNGHLTSLFAPFPGHDPRASPRDDPKERVDPHVVMVWSTTDLATSSSVLPYYCCGGLALFLVCGLLWVLFCFFFLKKNQTSKVDGLEKEGYMLSTDLQLAFFLHLKDVAR